MKDVLTGMIGDSIIEKVASQAGVDPKTAQTIFDTMAPTMTGAMAKNTASKQGADSLQNALSNKHNGSVFQDPTQVLNPEGEVDGMKILNHVFGEKEQEVEQVISEQVGADQKDTKRTMALFAPFILGALGKQAQAAGVDTGMLSGMLKDVSEGLSKDGSKTTMLKSVLDLDNDGKIMDDVPKLIGFLGIIKKFFGGKSNT